MEKRVYFKGWFLPALLITPQLLITAIFFFYPAGTAIWWSLFNPDPFGLSTKFVGFANFDFLFSDLLLQRKFLYHCYFFFAGHIIFDGDLHSILRFLQTA